MCLVLKERASELGGHYFLGCEYTYFFGLPNSFAPGLFYLQHHMCIVLFSVPKISLRV
jgi:hypothetical protein